MRGIQQVLLAKPPKDLVGRTSVHPPLATDTRPSVSTVQKLMKYKPLITYILKILAQSPFFRTQIPNPSPWVRI